jgi:hypothetical protein
MSTSVPIRATRPWLTLLIALSLTCTLVVALSQVTAASTISPRELVPLLTRSGVGPDLTIIDVTYAPPLFFDATGIPVPDEMDAETTLAFILQETVHDGDLPIDVAEAFLLLPDSTRVEPYDARVTAEDPHHRVSRVLFDRPDDWPAVIEDEDGMSMLTVVVPMRDGSISVVNTFEWVVPIEIGESGADSQ